MSKVAKERRENRWRLSMSMPCIISTDTKTWDEGTTCDIGREGMCVFSKKNIDAGHAIEIRCNAIWDQPKNGTVKWYHKIKDNLYRTGISFSS